MEFRYFVGIDISKNTLDLTVLSSGSEPAHETIGNNTAELGAYCARLKKLDGFSWGGTLFCMEHTGIYNTFLLGYLCGKRACVWVEHAQRIKDAHSTLRGKNDRVDSGRIAGYAMRNREAAVLWQPPRTELRQLAQLVAMRGRLVKARRLMTQPEGEGSLFRAKGDIAQGDYSKETVDGIDRDMAKTEAAIAAVIEGDERLSELFALVTSVPGVGPVVAANVLVSTDEFRRFTDADKYACHCGVVPFEHTSGTSVKRRSRVHRMANRKLKTLFHLAAVSTLSTKGELRQYYDRMIGRGKHKMAVLNAIRNKIIHRIFAAVKRNTPYEKKYEPKLA